MIKNATLIFDVGKTNKKLYVLDSHLNEIHKEYIRFDEIHDDDGYPCDDLQAISQWMLNSVKELLQSSRFEIKNINFSTYGASLVHLDKYGNIIAPFYNYLKPFPEDLKDQFLRTHCSEESFALRTGSPFMGFLNSGLQLYFIKYKKAEVFQNLGYSLHFPQYLSYLLTKEVNAEFTSIGCHTGLWDFENHKYASWVKDEGLDKYLIPAGSTSKIHPSKLQELTVNVGIGVHDSSSALLPYIISCPKPFVLISTGTWSICMNPFNHQKLSALELEKDCLTFMSSTGQPIKTSRLFLGKELRVQAMRLGLHFGVVYHRYKEVAFNPDFKPIERMPKELVYKYENLDIAKFGFTTSDEEDMSVFDDFDHAYHQLMHELTDLQIASLQLAIGSTKVKNIFIDGGFVDNELFTQMLANKLPYFTIQSTEFALGSSLGAAILVNNVRQMDHFMVKNYQPRIHHPISLGEGSRLF